VDSAVCIATGYDLCGPGVGFRVPIGNFLLFTTFGTEKSGRDKKLTSKFELVQSSKVRGSIHELTETTTLHNGKSVNHRKKITFLGGGGIHGMQNTNATSYIGQNEARTFQINYRELKFLAKQQIFRTYFVSMTSGLPLRSTGQSSWLKIQRSGFDSRRYQIF
jgi:hypothetical protein